MVRGLRSWKLDINVNDILSLISSKITGGNKEGIDVTFSQATGLFNFLVRPDNTTVQINSSNNIEVKEVSSDLVSYGELTLSEVLDDLLYIAPNVVLSGGSSHEKGETVTSVSLTWTLNKDITSQSINQGIGTLDVELRVYTHSGQTITTNRTYTITVSDGVNSDTSSITVAFYNKRYYGVSADDTLSDAEILAQLSGEYSSSRVQTRTFDCSGGKYFYIVYPTSWGTASFKVGGLSFSDMNLETRSFTNASGYAESYNIYRPNNIQTGSAILVEVS